MRIKLATLAAAAGLTLLSLPMTAEARGIEIGWLDCVVGKAGRVEVFTSDRDVHCTYTPLGGLHRPEHYVGRIEKFGLNIGATGHKVMQWKVSTIGGDPYRPGSLAGRYMGVSAEVTAAGGIGANILGGGPHDSFLLQPLSIQQQGGLNVAAGVTRFTLSSGGH